MAEVTTQGPSGNAEWGITIVGADFGRPQKIRFLPDAANDALEAGGRLAVAHALPDQPMLALDAGGAPVFSLTLILERQPRPDEDNIAPLVRQGVMNFDVTLALEALLLESLGCRDKVVYRSLFASAVDFSLMSGDGTTLLGSATTTGSDARAAIHANLNGAVARAVLAALNGQAGALRVAARLRFPVVAEMRQVTLHGSWAAIHDYLDTFTGGTDDFDGATLRQLFSAMIDAGIVMVSDGSGQALPAAVAAEYYNTFVRLAGVVLQRLTPELPSNSEDNRYALRERPHAMFNLEYREAVGGNHEDEVTLNADLCDVLAGELPADDWDHYIHLVAPDSSGGVAPAPRRVVARSQRRRLPITTTQPARMAATGNQIRSVALAIAPQERSVASLIGNASLQPVVSEVVGTHISHTWMLDDLILDQTQAIQTMKLPVVENSRANLWRDKDDSRLYWYAPEFVLPNPVPTAEPAESPFLFEFETTGVTSDGKPALEGKVVFIIEMHLSEEVQKELHRLGNVKSRMVTVNALSIGLEVPFVDEHGVTRASRFPAEVARNGTTVTAEVALINDWVRLCYGALSMANFQRQSAQLHIGYSFPACVPADKNKVELVFGGKTAITPVVYNSSEAVKVKDAVFLDAATASLHVPAGVLKLKHETPLARASSERLAVAGGHAGAITANVATAVQTKPFKASTVAVRPELAVAASGVVPDRTRHVRRSVARQESHTAFYSCANLGVFYRERINDHTQAVGCRDALKLGQTVYRQYEEMVALRQSHFSVYRSLQQPGRFLVLPHQYTIARHVPGSTAAYRPCAILYSVIDAANAANNRVVFEASLQPDIAAFELYELRESLAAYATSPILEFPTEVMTDADYRWTIGSALSEPTVIELGDSIRVAMDVNLPGGLLLQDMLSHAGIQASVDFKLGDGTSLRSTLVLDLNRITGPWEQGPLSLTDAGGATQLTNQIEQALTVSKLQRYVEGMKVEEVAVNTTLSAEQSVVVALGDAGGDLVPIYTQLARGGTTLKESRVFVEDVTTNVVFFVQLNYANHDLQRIEIRTRLKDMAGEQSVALSGDPPVGSVNITLPLTDYLNEQVIQYQVTKVFNDDSRAATSWMDWNLQESGNIISVSWEMIGA